MKTLTLILLFLAVSFAIPGVNWAELIARTDEVEAGTNYGASADITTNHVINIQ